MRTFVVLVFMNLVIGLFQTSVFPELMVASHVPNLVVAFSFALFLFGKEKRSLQSAYIGGLVVDFLTLATPGISSLLMVSALLAVSFIKRFIYKGPITSGILLYIFSVLYAFVITIPNFVWDSKVLFGAFLTFLASLVFYQLVLKKFYSVS